MGCSAAARPRDWPVIDEAFDAAVDALPEDRKLAERELAERDVDAGAAVGISTDSSISSCSCTRRFKRVRYCG